MNLICPVPLPDEMMLSYKGWVMRLNGLHNSSALKQALLERAGKAGANLREVPIAELLAQVAGMATDEFVRAHTLLPLACVMRHDGGGKLLGDPADKSLLWSFAIRDFRQGAYLCPRCVQEDVDFHGRAYWRREHQLPGAFWCAKHGDPLHYVNDLDAYLRSPTDCIATAVPIADNWVKQLQGNAAIQRFLDIASHLLSSKVSLGKLGLSRYVRDYAKANNLHWGKGKAIAKPLISDLLLQVYGVAWLSTVVPNLEEKKPGLFWRPIDAVTLAQSGNLLPPVYVAVFAALHDTMDAACEALERAGSEQSCVIAKQEAPQNLDSLVDAYAGSRGSHRQAARALKVPHRTAVFQMRNAGLPAMSEAKLRRIAAPLTRFVEGGDLSAVCQGDRALQVEVEEVLRRIGRPLAAAILKMEGKIAEQLRRAKEHAQRSGKSPARRTRRQRPFLPPDQALHGSTAVDSSA